MQPKALLGLLTAFNFVPSAWSFGTIVEVYPSICPALPSEPTIPPVQYLLTATLGSGSNSAGAPTYISANGNTTADCSGAAPFVMRNGQLSSNGYFVSTTGLVPSSPLAVSSYVASISTTFSIMNGDNLAWNNTAFTGGHAIFCVASYMVEAVYNGVLPAGCAQASIGLVPVDSCPTFRPSSLTTQPTATGSGITRATDSSSPSPTASVVPGSITGINATANPIGCLSSSSDIPAVSGGLAPISVSTLEQCVDYCSKYAYFGVQSGLCVCGNNVASSATPAIFGSCNVACSGNRSQSCGGANAMAVYTVVGRSGSASTGGMSTNTGTGSAGQGSTSTGVLSTNTGTVSAWQGGSTAVLSTNTGTGSAGQGSASTGVLSTNTGTGSAGQGGSSTGVLSTNTGTGSGQGSTSTGILSTNTGTGSSGQASSSTSTTTSSMTGYPTSTGSPNCFGRSPFDLTVNGGYLIVCNTALSGFDITSANGASLAECIAACSAYSAINAGNVCVAVTFDTFATSNQCRLKSNIGIVNAGAENLSEAAIIVTGAYAPQIVFATAAMTMTSTGAPTASISSTEATVVSSTTSPASGSFTSTSELPSASTPSSGSVSTPSFSTTPSIVVSTPSTSTTPPSVIVPTPSTSTTPSSVVGPTPSTSTTPASVIVSTPSTSTSPTSQGALPTVSNPSGALCPTYNGQVVNVGGSSYQVACSTDTFGDTLIANTTTAASLAECGGYCNLYNQAIPFGCVGVTLLTTSSFLNCYLKSTITGIEFRVQDDSLRLIYPGYPTPTDPVLTASSTTGSALSSASATISMATSTESSSSTGPMATNSMATSTESSSSTGPTATAALCPASNGQVLYFPSYGGSNYEIACSTNFADSDLSSVLATSLTDCINQCSFVNVNGQTPLCIGVTFLNTPQPDPPRNNCYLKNSITTIVRGIPQDDSARLIYSGYPSATDMGTMGSSSAPALSTSMQASSSIPPAGGTQSTSTSSTVLGSGSNGVVTASASSISPGSSTTTSAAISVASPTGSLCPTYSFQVIQAGSYQYEIECGFEIQGRDIGLPYSPYPAIQSFQQCLAACNFWNENTSTLCIAAVFEAGINVCYLKDTIGGRLPSLTLNAARLIYSGNPSITDAVSVSASALASTTSTSNLAISSSSTPAAASVYPAEPVCPVYNGGQLTSPGRNLYDIECNVDLRYAPSDLASTSVVYAATYSACALICDQYNVNAGSRICQGFTWDGTSTTTAASNCVLKSALIQTSTDNTANTNGVHSGRLLGPWPATNEVLLSMPIPLVTNTLYNGYSITHDFGVLTAPGGLTWQITEYSNATLYVGANGFLALSRTDLNNEVGRTGLSNSINNDSQPYSLPSTVLPTYAVAAYWNRGYASLSSQQGIYYQIDTVSAGRYFISIEFYYFRFTTNDAYHWITTYDTGNRGVWTSWHFSGGSADDRGLYQTVGHQGTQTLNGVAGLTIAAMYQNGQAGTVNSGDRIVFNTNPNINTVVHSAAAFNVTTYGVPGTWSYANSPT